MARITAHPDSGAGAPAIEVTAEMIKVGRDTLLASFPEDALSERTAGLCSAVSDIFRAMLQASGRSSF